MATSALTRTAEAADTACRHCGLPVPRGLIDPGAREQFCCAGCRTVYAMLSEHGLDRYYDLVDGDEARPAAVTDRTYAELDTDDVAGRHVRELAGGLRSIRLYLEGIHCTACVWLVERLPRVLDGVVEARVDLGRSTAEVVWDPTAVPLSRVARAIDSLGYPVHPYRGEARLELRRREERALLIKIAVAGAAAGNAMLLAAALYAGLFGDMSAPYRQLLRWTSLVVTAPAFLFAAQPFLRGALGALRARALHMDLPIAVGLTAGFVAGLINTVRGAGEVYFDSVSALIFLLLVGRWIQLRQQRRAADAAELLFSLTPSSARVVEAGAVRDVPLDALVVGMTVEVRAGDTVPVDGVVVSGRSAVNAALLTGESMPAPIDVGDEVHAGTVNLSSPVRVVARATGDDTRVGRLMRHVEEEARRRAPIVRAADRVIGIFVVSVLVLSAVTFVAWLSAGPERAVENAVALLVVTCPCALGLATPLAVSVAIGRAARRGILIKGGDALERMARPGTMILDKTGTLTEGKQRLVDWHGSDDARRRAAALEQGSAHPLARALVAATPGPLPVATDVAELIGGGIRGTVNGVAVVCGSPAYVAAVVGPLPAELARVVDHDARAGQTPIVVAEEGRAVAAASFGDPIRADAADTLAALRDSGWQLRIVSGDHPTVVRAVGARLGIAAADCIGGATPEDKLAHARAAAARGPVVMVGDGVNDAAALAAATCGIAVHGSAEASLAGADVFIERPGLAGVAELASGAGSAMRVIRRNLGLSLVYNLAGASLAVAGLLHPLVAALLMPLSSISVVTSSVHAHTFPRARVERSKR